MSTINEMLTAAVAARKDSLVALRSRIADLLKPLPIGVILSDESGEVCKVVRICTGASQWSNRTWDVTIKGKGAVSDGKLLCEIDLDNSYWDGNNMHVRSTEPTCLGRGDEEDPKVLAYLSGTETRALAARLPAAIESYMALCEREREANASTLA